MDTPIGNLIPESKEDLEARLKENAAKLMGPAGSEIIGSCKINDCHGNIIVHSHFQNASVIMGSPPVMRETRRDCYCIVCGVAYKESVVRSIGS